MLGGIHIVATVIHAGLVIGVKNIIYGTLFETLNKADAFYFSMINNRKVNYLFKNKD